MCDFVHLMIPFGLIVLIICTILAGNGSEWWWSALTAGVATLVALGLTMPLTPAGAYVFDGAWTVEVAVVLAGSAAIGYAIGRRSRRRREPLL